MKGYKLTEKEGNGNIYYYATFTDGQGNEHTIEIEREVFDAIDASQKKIRSQARKNRRYGLCAFDDSIGDIADGSREEDDELINALYIEMGALTDAQKRRFILHYFQKKTYETIANIEGTNKAAIQQSIHLALKKLEKVKKLFD